jgi:predicted aspartyl protease
MMVSGNMKFRSVKVSAVMVLFLVAFLSSAPVTLSAPATGEIPLATGIPFKYAAGHILIIPVTVGDRESSFVLDTGAGVNVISQTLADKLHCKSVGKVTGKRMSGQKITMKLVNLPALKIGPCLQKNLPIAAWKLEDVFAGASPEMAKVEGFASLEFFKKIPFTVDYAQKMLFIENEDSLQQRLLSGTPVPIQISKGRAQTSITMPLYFSNGSFARVEVDTGSGALILNEKYINELGVHTASPDVKMVKGVDETGHEYVRCFTKLPLDAFLAQSRQFTQLKPNVQFQRIIYDGLVGDGFLSNFIVTYDLPHKRMIFAPRPKILDAAP